jgi:hypothetical protein
MTDVRRRLPLVALALACALLAGGCRKVLSEPVLEASASEIVSQMSGAEIRVDCPAGRSMRVDNDFFCQTHVADRTGWLLVHQTDDYGRITFEYDEPLDRREMARLVAAFLARQYGVEGAKVTCPGRIVQQPDRNFTCTVAGSEPVDVRQVDGVHEYVYTWRGANETGGAG